MIDDGTSIIDSPIGAKADGVFTPHPQYVAKIAEEKDTKEWANALEVGRLAVDSFRDQTPTDQELLDRMQKIWVWMTT